MESQVTTSTSSTDSVLKDESSSDIDYLTLQPPELLTKITDRTLLADHLRLRLTSNRLNSIATKGLATKRRLVLAIGYAPSPPDYETPNPQNKQLGRQLDHWQAAMRRLLSEQRQQQQPNSKKQIKQIQSTTSSTVFAELDEEFLSELNQQEEEDEDYYDERRLASGYRLEHAVAFRRAGFQPRLLPAVTSFEVHYISHQTDCLVLASAALGSLLHLLRPNEQGPPILLTAFALYALTFGSNNFFLKFLVRFFRVLRSNTTANLKPSTESTLNSNPNPSISSLKTLRSLTFFTRRPIIDQIGNGLGNMPVEDLESFILNGPLDNGGPLDQLPVFLAVEELLLGGIDGTLLRFLLGILFPSLRRLVLVLHESSETESANSLAEVSVADLKRHISMMSAGLRRQLTHLSVYSFDRVMQLNKNKKDKKDVVINLAHGKLVAFVKKNFPNVVHFNGEAI